MFNLLPLLQSGAAEFTIGEAIRQGGLALAVVLCITAIVWLVRAYNKKDEALTDALEATKKAKDEANAAKEKAVKEERERMEEILKEKDRIITDSAKKFEDLSEKFREKTTDLALSNQRFTMEMASELKSLNLLLKTGFDNLSTTLNNAVSGDGS